MIADTPLLGFKNMELVGNPIHLESEAAVSSYGWYKLDGDRDKAYLLMMDLRLNASSVDKYLYMRMNGAAPTGPWWEEHVAGHNNSVKSHDVTYGNDYLAELGITRTANAGPTRLTGFSLIFTPKNINKVIKSFVTRKNDTGASVSFQEMIESTANNGLTSKITSLHLMYQSTFYGDFALYKLGI